VIIFVQINLFLKGSTYVFSSVAVNKRDPKIINIDFKWIQKSTMICMHKRHTPQMFIKWTSLNSSLKSATSQLSNVPKFIIIIVGSGAYGVVIACED
jgi:hypothetical protein